ncbi:hypothetical protein V1511DRAFT_506785 [Dipodascopsis uninucleata]
MTEEIRTLPHSEDFTESAVQQRSIIELVWKEVEDVVEDYKRDVWETLGQTRPDDNFLKPMSILLELGVEDNPIWVWLQTIVDDLRSKLIDSFDKLNSSLLVIRQDLQKENVTNDELAESLLMAITKYSGAIQNDVPRDQKSIDQMWTLLFSLISEVTKYFEKQISLFWGCASSFLNGYYQRNLPMGQNGESRSHLTFSESEAATIRNDGKDLVDIFASRLTEFFENSVELSTEKTPNFEARDQVLSDTDGRNTSLRDNLNNGLNTYSTDPDSSSSSVCLSASAVLANNLRNDRNSENSDLATSHLKLVEQPISSNLGRNYNLYAFLPVSANAIGTSFYLSQIIGVIGTSASRLAGLSISSEHVEILREMMGTIRERCIDATCLTWQQDAKKFKLLEDWKVSKSRSGTKIPSFFLHYQILVLDGLQRVLFVNEAERVFNVSVVLPPSSRLISSIKTQFVNTIFLSLDGLVKVAVISEKKPRVQEDEFTIDLAKVTTIPMESRILLTTCNIFELQNRVIPKLFSHFSQAFSIQLTDNSNIIGDALKQLDEQLFTAFMKRKRTTFMNIIKNGILKSKDVWCRSERPMDVSVFIYESLLQLVIIHSKVYSVAPPLIFRVITDLLQHIATNVRDSFGQIERFSLEGMLQATIDVEFINQKLTSFVTPEIDAIFQSTYTSVQNSTDRTQMDVTLMTKQLEDMKKLLLRCHKLSRLEFICFKEEKQTKSKEKDAYISFKSNSRLEPRT